MKKGFIGKIFEDNMLGISTMFVLFTPLWILLMIKMGFSWFMTFWGVLCYYYLISSYIEFNPEEYKKKKELKEWVDSLSLEEIKKLKDKEVKK